MYIQSSGGHIPWILNPVMNKGVNYIEGIMKFIGIKKFKELPVNGTGFTKEEKQDAINKAIDEIDDVIDSMKY